MKIAIDISPLQSGHKVRGVGFYLQHLKDALVKYYPDHEYLFFTETRELKADIDIVHYPYFDPFYLTLPIFESTPRIVTVHDLTPLVFPENFPSGIKGKLKWQIQKQGLIGSDRIITDSISSKNDIVKYTGIAADKIDVIYLAAGEEFARLKIEDLRSKKLKDKYNLPDKFVLYVGDATWNKNLPRLITAALAAEVPLIMVGKALTETEFDKNNPWNKDLVETKELISSQTSDVRRQITALGFVPSPDLVKIYNLATVFVMPSLYEGFGLPILEAMQSGCPVITSEEGSLPEVAGSAAFYVDAYDTDSIAEGIEKVFKNAKLQKELSDKGLKQTKRFSWKATAKQTVQAYEKALRT